MNAPYPPYWTLNSCFVASHIIWMHLANFRYYTKLGANRVEMVQLMQKFVPRSRVGIFAMNAPDPTHYTLNWCCGAFRTIWVRSGPFGCLTKLGAKRAELVQMFVPRSRVRIFRDECTRYTPLDPKMTFWCVSYYLGAFGTVWFSYETRCKTGRTSAEDRATKSHRNFSQWM